MAGDQGFVKIAGRTVGHFLTVADDGDMFADFQHFAHFVTDKQNGNSARLDILDDAKKRFDFLAGQGGCRFIHDDQTGI